MTRLRGAAWREPPQSDVLAGGMIYDWKRPHLSHELVIVFLCKYFHILYSAPQSSVPLLVILPPRLPPSGSFWSWNESL